MAAGFDDVLALWRQVNLLKLTKEASGGSVVSASAAADAFDAEGGAVDDGTWLEAK